MSVYSSPTYQQYSTESTPKLLDRYQLTDYSYNNNNNIYMNNNNSNSNNSNQSSYIDYGIDNIGSNSVPVTVTDSNIDDNNDNNNNDNDYIIDYNYDNDDDEQYISKKVCCMLCCNNTLDYVLQIICCPCYITFSIVQCMKNIMYKNNNNDINYQRHHKYEPIQR